MLSQRSIKGEYAKQLAFSSLALIAVFSFILYAYIKSALYSELREELLTEARYIASSESRYPLDRSIDAHSLSPLRSGELQILISSTPKRESGTIFREFKEGGKLFFQIQHPYDKHENSSILITKEISGIQKILGTILNSIMIINFGGLILVQIYAFTLSKLLSKPIAELSQTLARMNENMLKPIEIETIPEELTPLGNSLNQLIDRLQRYIGYQKELFIGIAHELRTPLAVMKAKCDLALMKPRESEKYIEVLRNNIQQINTMDSMVRSVLDIGRQEGAQFEQSELIDVIEFLRRSSEGFALVAKQEGKELILNLQPEGLKLYIQPTLLLQIIQNFLKNAIKFTPSGRPILLQSKTHKNRLRIEVLDEGCGIEGNIDIFAPFKRTGDKSGAGLGLFLAKSAADSMGATITLENRPDTQGAIATLEIPLRQPKAAKRAFPVARLWQNRQP